MKRIILTTLVLAISAAFASAQNGMYTITSGNASITVNANEGGKIMSLKCGDNEVLNQGRFPNSYGSTFWTSPQKEWNWPPVAEIDRLPYLAYEFGDKIVLASKLSAKIPMRIIKTIYAGKEEGSFVIEYMIKNESGSERKVSPWEISRVKSKGLVFFEAPVSSIWPDNLMKFNSAYGLSWYTFDVEKQNRKVNTTEGNGWLGYAGNDVLLVKRFQDLKLGQPAPDEAEIQVYVNLGDSYTEIESQGAYTTLQPGETLTWTVKWFVTPFKTPEAMTEELARAAKKLGHKKL